MYSIGNEPRSTRPPRASINSRNPAGHRLLVGQDVRQGLGSLFVAGMSPGASVGQVRGERAILDLEQLIAAGRWFSAACGMNFLCTCCLIQHLVAGRAAQLIQRIPRHAQHDDRHRDQGDVRPSAEIIGSRPGKRSSGSASMVIVLMTRR